MWNAPSERCARLRHANEVMIALGPPRPKTDSVTSSLPARAARRRRRAQRAAARSAAGKRTRLLKAIIESVILALTSIFSYRRT